MNHTLLVSLMAFVPAGFLFLGALAFFRMSKTVAGWLQVIGSTCLVLVVLMHCFEALQLFPGMHWGAEQSIGHYLDLSCALLAVVLFPIGYFLQALASRRGRPPGVKA